MSRWKRLGPPRKPAKQTQAKSKPKSTSKDKKNGGGSKETPVQEGKLKGGEYGGLSPLIVKRHMRVEVVCTEPTTNTPPTWKDPKGNKVPDSPKRKFK